MLELQQYNKCNKLAQAVQLAHPSERTSGRISWAMQARTFSRSASQKRLYDVPGCLGAFGSFFAFFGFGSSCPACASSSSEDVSALSLLAIPCN